MGILFNGVNGYLNGRHIFTLSGGYASSWLRDPRFIIGAMIFILGYAINRRADLILRSLRRPGETDYKVSNQWLYRWVSCPNYLGEIMQWVGWAIATWSLAGLAFAVWTAANLIPRARANHAWYRNNFANYPAERKALLPRVW
jgi:steroid 5-alpha-reductase/3-oxo-5-alpha-steroid 4-dehydrogenase 1